MEVNRVAPWHSIAFLSNSFSPVQISLKFYLHSVQLSFCKSHGCLGEPARNGSEGACHGFDSSCCLCSLTICSSRPRESRGIPWQYYIYVKRSFDIRPKLESDLLQCSLTRFSGNDYEDVLRKYWPNRYKPCKQGPSTWPSTLKFDPSYSNLNYQGSKYLSRNLIHRTNIRSV